MRQFHRRLLPEALHVPIDRCDRERAPAALETHEGVLSLEVAVDRERVPHFGVADIVDRGVVVLAPEERDRRELLALPEQVERRGLALALGDDSAASLGTRPGRTRALVMVCVTLLAGLATALAGPIAFIGLAVPHLVRGVTRARLGWLFALSLPVGAATILLCDVFGRLIARPGEVPVGVTTALLGGVLLALMARRLTVVTL